MGRRSKICMHSSVSLLSHRNTSSALKLRRDTGLCNTSTKTFAILPINAFLQFNILICKCITVSADVAKLHADLLSNTAGIAQIIDHWLQTVENPARICCSLGREPICDGLCNQYGNAVHHETQGAAFHHAGMSLTAVMSLIQR